MIYTFYSFKGGVGRSMALANTAELMCAHGLDVLVIDFDLEAPGLERFFEVDDALTAHADIVRSRGVVDLILSYKTLRSFSAELKDEPEAVLFADEKASAPGANGERTAASAERALRRRVNSEPLDHFIVPIHAREGAGHLWLMPAGRRDEDEYALYADRVASLDLLDLYTNWGGQEFFDWFIDEVNNFAPVVLIDSRTGITEMSGVCTHHLADAVALLVAPNEQNIDGIKRIIRSLEQPDLVRKARKERPLALLLVPSRVEASEGDKLDAFAARFDKELGPHIDSRLVFERGAFVDLRIPYVPHYAYVETVAVRESDSPKAADLVVAYNRITLALIELADKQGIVYRTYHSQEAVTSHSFGSGFPRAPMDFVLREWVLERIVSWLWDSKSPTFIVTGAPGSGKTALMAYFAQNGFRRDEPGADSPAPVVFAFSCDSGRSDALVFIAELARALAATYPAYLQQLIQSARSEPEVSLRVLQRIGAASGGVLPAPRALESIDLGRLSPAAAFHLVLSRPLHAMFDSGHIFAIIVDGLDAVDSRENDILQLLMSAAKGGFPRNVRLILATRKDMRVLKGFAGLSLDLIENAPDPARDTYVYLLRKLEKFPGAEPASMADALAKTAGGNFLVATLLVATLADASTPAQLWSRIDRMVNDSGLVPQIRDLYAADLGTFIGANAEQWAGVYRPLLTTLAAARERLRPQQLAGIVKLSRSELADALRGAARFLSGDLPEGPFALVHNSLAEFIVRDPEIGVELGEIHERIADFFIAEFEGAWNRVADPYPLLHTARHLLSALGQAEERRRKKELSEKLVALLFEYDYLEARLALGAVLMLIEDIDETMRIGELSDSTKDLDALRRFLLANSDMLRSWNTSQDPDLFLRLVSAPQARVPRVQPPREQTAQAEALAGNPAVGTASPRLDVERIRESIRGTKVPVSSLRLKEIPDLPPSMLAGLRHFQEARSFGGIWLMVTFTLCASTIIITLLELAVPFELVRSLCILTIVGGVWNLYALAFGKVKDDMAYATTHLEVEYSESRRVALDEFEVLRAKRYYRLVGSLFIVSPFPEATIILYVASVVVMAASRILPQVFFFRP